MKKKPISHLLYKELLKKTEKIEFFEKSLEKILKDIKFLKHSVLKIERKIK